MVSYVATGRDKGRFVHTAPDGRDTVIEVPNSYGDLSLEERTVILKLHGRSTPIPRGTRELRGDRGRLHRLRCERRRSSLVPVTLAAVLRRSHFLFLGYSLRDWYREASSTERGVRDDSRTDPGPSTPVPVPWSASSGETAMSRASTRPSRPTSRLAPGPRQRSSALSVNDRTTEAAAATLPDSPYKGLASYEDTDLDAALFFGRERDSQILAANLVAFRLTVLYGPSGIGKSSIVRAGVARELRREDGLPVAVFSAWSGDPVQGIVDEVARVVGIAPPERDARGCAWDDRPANGPGALPRAGSDRGVLRLPRGGAADGGFAEQFPELVGRADIPVNVLLAIREDALAALDRFKPGLPSLFGNCVRLGPLDDHGARTAITGPLDEYSRRAGPDNAVSIEPELVDAILGDVSGSETSYLQLVMERLWDEERRSGSRTLGYPRSSGSAAGMRSPGTPAQSLGALTDEQRDSAALIREPPRRRRGRRSPTAPPTSHTTPARIVTPCHQFSPGLPTSASSAPFPRRTTLVQHTTSSSTTFLPGRRSTGGHDTRRSGALRRNVRRRPGGTAAYGFSPHRLWPRSRDGGCHRLRADPATRGNDAGDDGTLAGVGGKRCLAATHRSELSLLLALAAARERPTPQAEGALRQALLASRVDTVRCRPGHDDRSGQRSRAAGGEDGNVRLIDPATGDVTTTLDVGSPVVRPRSMTTAPSSRRSGKTEFATSGTRRTDRARARPARAWSTWAWGPGECESRPTTMEPLSSREVRLRRSRPTTTRQSRSRRRQSGWIDVPDSRAGRTGARLVSRDREAAPELPHDYAVTLRPSVGTA